MEHGAINVAVEAYLRAYMQPPLTAEQIYLGQQNNSALPKTREHVVFFLASTRRIGTAPQSMMTHSLVSSLTT